MMRMMRRRRRKGMEWGGKVGKSGG